MIKITALYTVLLFLLMSISLKGQIHQDSKPWSLEVNGLSDSFQYQSIAPPGSFISTNTKNLSKPTYKPGQFGELIPLEISPLSGGTVEALADGRKIWRLKLSLEGTQAISLYFTDFELPQGIEFYLYNPKGEQLLGAYTNANNSVSGRFSTSLIRSSSVILELNIPSSITLDDWFTISEISYIWDLNPERAEVLGFGSSDFCEVNVKCSPEGDNWQDEKRGVVRIQVKSNGGLFWCTGTMVNNARYDNTPYLLTADHCSYKYGDYASVEDLNDWIFYFNYESEECDNPSVEPELQSLIGCEKIAHGGFRGMTGSDFFLAKLNDEIPAEWNVYFNGWSAVDESSDQGVTIHHPDGDIKKISTYTDELTTVSWQGSGLPSHWKVVWVETETNWGVTEGGSSGAPIYDPEGHIIGTLTGGLASCWNQDDPDYYGKFSYHWESNGGHDTTRLKPWLDPDNKGILILDGSTMGIHNQSINDDFLDMELYPNPAGDRLNIRFNQAMNTAHFVEVLDLLGSVLMTIELSAGNREYKMNINQLKPGIYFIRKSDAPGSLVRKFIKR